MTSNQKIYSLKFQNAISPRCLSNCVYDYGLEPHSLLRYFVVVSLPSVQWPEELLRFSRHSLTSHEIRYSENYSMLEMQQTKKRCISDDRFKTRTKKYTQQFFFACALCRNHWKKSVGFLCSPHCVGQIPLKMHFVPNAQSWTVIHEICLLMSSNWCHNHPQTRCFQSCRLH